VSEPSQLSATAAVWLDMAGIRRRTWPREENGGRTVRINGRGTVLH